MNRYATKRQLGTAVKVDVRGGCVVVERPSWQTSAKFDGWFAQSELALTFTRSEDGTYMAPVELNGHDNLAHALKVLSVADEFSGVMLSAAAKLLSGQGGVSNE